MLMSLLIFAIVFFGALYLMESKLGIDKEDMNVMFVGAFGFKFIINLSMLLGAVVGGIFSLPMLIAVLIDGALCYYFYKKSDL